MELLTYNQAYEAQVVELWNQELFADPITVHKFRQQALLDDNFDSDLCYVAEDGKTAGFLLATKRKFRIWNVARSLSADGLTRCSWQGNTRAKESAQSSS